MGNIDSSALMSFDVCTRTTRVIEYLFKEDKSAGVVGSAFSPNNRFLYVIEPVLSINGNILYQYDLNAIDIQQSKIQISDPLGPDLYMDFQITNSGKIFFHSLKPQGTIGEIKNPNELGLLSNVDLNYGVVCGNFCIAPNASILKKPLMTYQALISTDTIICLGSSIVPLLPECFDSLVWDGEMLNMEILEPEEAGDYVFRVYQNQSVYTDTISIQIFNDEIVNIDTSICESERFTIDGTDINQSGIYFDSLVSIFGCDSVIRYEVNIRSCP